MKFKKLLYNKNLTMHMRKLIIVGLFVIVIIAIVGLYFNKNIEKNFEVVGTLELWTVKGYGQTPCGFTGLIDYNNRWYEVQVPSNKCELYESLKNKRVKVIGSLKIRNTGKQPEYSQIKDNIDIYTIHPTEIFEFNN